MRKSDLDLYMQESSPGYLQGVEDMMFHRPHNFRVDVIDGGDHYDLCAEFPGIPKEDIHMEVADNKLILSAHHEETQEEAGHSYLRRERYYGNFHRQFDVSTIDVDKITAKYNHGVLYVVMPKKPVVTGKGKKIVIE